LRLAKGGYEFIRLRRLLVLSRIHPGQGSIHLRSVQQEESVGFFGWAREFLAEEIRGDARIGAIIEEKLASLKTAAGQYDGKQYWNRMLEERFDEGGVCRREWPLSYNRWLHRQQRRTFKKLLARACFDPGTARVCEIGPGTGFWTEQFARLGVSRYRAFDISVAAVRRLQQRYPGYEFVECDFGEYHPAAGEAGSFDLAVGIQVFLHVTDNDRFAKCWQNLGRLLKKDSLAIVLDAVAVHPLRGRQQASGDGPGFNPTLHNKVRNLEAYRRVAAAAGFSLQKVVPAFTLTQSSFDFATALGSRFWNFYYFRFLSRVLRTAGEKRGSMLGATLSFLDGLVTPLTGKGISSKWLVFKKKRLRSRA
jgi:SAM-dependent methyltransferase